MTSGDATPSRENLAKASAAYGLGLSREKLLELLYLLCTCWLHLLWASGSVNNVHSDPFAAHGVMA
jgi:hypothetical protein